MDKTDEKAKEEYKKDSRIACKYGINCYQKNPAHSDKFKHPPLPPLKKKNFKDVNAIEPPTKRLKLDNLNTTDDTNGEGSLNTTTPISVTETGECKLGEGTETENVITASMSPLSTSGEQAELDVKVPSIIDEKEFIKKQFLVEMPPDFYNFWDFCRNLNPSNPLNALKDASLTLVGPFEVLAGKFCSTPVKTSEEYVLHWRYYFDPPEFQTVMRRTDNSGYHIGYFRDSPQQMPLFLAYNFPKVDGTFTPVGDNIFAAVSLFLKFSFKNANPFSKISITKYKSLVEKEADKMGFSLSKITSKMTARNKNISSRTFNKLGMVVPYNKKTQVGYRPLSMSNKDLSKLLSQIDGAKTPSDRDNLMIKLQGLLTCVDIALDECDFGTGLELGLDIVCAGVDSLNSVAARFLSNSYRLLDREAFGLIARSHMQKREKDITKLSVL